MPDISTAAPAFTLKDTARADVSLSDFAGKKVVLAFFPAAFTGVCTTELCTFRNSMSDLNALNTTVLGISVDSPFANGAFAAANELNFPLLSDYARETVKAYGVELHDFAGLPGYTAAQRSVFVVDEQGAIAYRWIAENPGIEPDYDAIKAVL